MGIKPHYNVTKQIVKPPKNPLYAGRVAVIGAFDTELTGVINAGTLSEAYSKLGTDTTYDGIKCLPILFGKGTPLRGVTSIVAVNITTTTTENSETVVQKEITPTKLTNALALLKNEKFDQIFIAGTCTSDMHVIPNPDASPAVVRSGTIESFVNIIQTFTAERYENKKACGYTLAVTPLGSSASDIQTDYTKVTEELIDDSCYGIIPNQPLKIGGTTYDLLQSNAYYAAWVASTKLDESLTTRQAPGVTGLATEYTFEDGDLGSALLAADYMVYEVYDRDEKIIELINSQQPNGLDLYITRVSDEIVRVIEFAFGHKSGKTIQECMSVMDSIKQKYVKDLEFLVDIQYHIEKEDSKTIDVVLDKLLFDDIVVVFNIPITIEVQ